MRDSFVTTIYRKKEIAFEKVGGSIGGAIGGAMLTEKQKEVLEIIKKDTSISYRKMAILLNINESAVLKHLDALKRAGVIVRIGGTRGYWKINEEIH